MPIVLVVLFVVALFITLAGFFLSPRTQTRRPQVRERSVPTPAAIPARAHRTTTVGSPQTARVPQRASALAGAESRTSQMAVQTYTRTPRTSADWLARSAAGRSGSAGLAYPAPWEGLKARLTAWQVAIPGLAVIFLLGVYLLHGVLPYSLLWMSVTFGSANAPSGPSSSNPPPVYTASKHLARLSQLDPAQYSSSQEFTLWAYSACSAASMTEVMNAYKHTYRIMDILEVEAAIHEITPDQGLLEEVGIQRTGARFGFKTTWGHNLSLNQVLAAANSGTPVIVSFPPARYPGGHILVVRGGDSTSVYLADSSRLNWLQITHDRFLQLWAGFYAIMTPA
jgi:hypothetical protein